MNTATEVRPLGSLPFGKNGYGSNGSQGRNGHSTIVLPVVMNLVKPIVFVSKEMRDLLHVIERIRKSDIPVFLVGETGTGKEVLVDRIHNQSVRAKQPLVKINCAALPHELIESELFGSRGKSYTGSSKEDREGLFQKANGGTLFLDEITEMPIGVQAKLLRVLQDMEIRPVGATEASAVDCRIIASTNREIEEVIQDRKLREDLMYRLSGMTIMIPPLRERTADIVPLAEQFLKYYASKENQAVQGFTSAALETIIHFGWPGNVRQLENAIRRAVLLADELVDVCHLSLLTLRAKKTIETAIVDGLSELDQAERSTIVAMLKRVGGVKLRAAEFLDISRQTLRNKIDRYLITPSEYLHNQQG